VGYGDICSVDPSISPGTEGRLAEAFVAGLQDDEIVIGRETRILGKSEREWKWRETGPRTLMCSLIQSTLWNIRGSIIIVGFE